MYAEARDIAGEEVPMRSNPLTRLTRVAIAAVAAGCAGLISHPVSNLDTTPTNDLPNPYRSVSPWGNLPTDHGKWGAFNGVAIDNDGRSVWVVDRCGANPDVPPAHRPSSTIAAPARAGRRCTSSTPMETS